MRNFGYQYFLHNVQILSLFDVLGSVSIFVTFALFPLFGDIFQVASNYLQHHVKFERALRIYNGTWPPRHHRLFAWHFLL